MHIRILYNFQNLYLEEIVAFLRNLLCKRQRGREEGGKFRQYIVNRPLKRDRELRLFTFDTIIKSRACKHQYSFSSLWNNAAHTVLVAANR